MKDLQLQGSDQRMAMLLRALSRPARVLIVKELCLLGACRTSTLIDALPLPQSTISDHLRLPESAQIIVGEIDGPSACYRPNDDTLRWLSAQIAPAAPPS